MGRQKKSYWLLDRVEGFDRQEGVFILKSTVNWAAALRCEIEAAHGVSPAEQVASLRQHFRRHAPAAPAATRAGEVYCLLFQALTSGTSFQTISTPERVPPWLYPTVVVAWYYTHYQVARAIEIGSGCPPKDDHASVAATFNQVASRMPHPYDMSARFQRSDGRCKPCLPRNAEAVPTRLVLTFDHSQAMAQGMLLNYLEGTGDRERDRIEAMIKKDKDVPYTDFRTQQARAYRNGKLAERPPFNFMHCAYRYRTKANYRDPLYLTYGSREDAAFRGFARNLAVSARFAVLCGIAHAERRYGRAETAAFIADLEQHFRGASEATDDEAFWRELRV
ncbi:MAG: hypothetical protein IT340_17170 [Chloroflexi bacterium]|nr:hypothetical protein [Chloroflexota bacterium]